MQFFRRSRQRRYLKQRLIIYGLIFLIIFVVSGFLFSFLVFAWYAKSLPSPGKLSNVSGYSSVFLDRDGKTLYEMYKDKNRVPVSLDQVSSYLKQATVAIEDKDFYKHKGISQIGILRAFLNILVRQQVQGGSTITQQLIKNVLLSSERTFSRKIKEMILALEVERRYTKDQILEMYLSEAPYGGTYWGVSSAAHAYFGKTPKELDLAESALLAGFPQGPSLYSPFIGKKDAWKGRGYDVLRRMREDSYITRTQEASAKDKIAKMKFTSPKLSIKAPHFVFYVKDQIEKKLGDKIFDQGVRIKTSLSLDVQEKVEKIVKEEIEKLKGYKVGNGAVIVLDSQTGEILAMVGSYDFDNEEFGKFNAAISLRQPGSAVKPITYALAFENGYTPASVIMDVKTDFPNQGDKDYTPVNYDGKYNGPIQLRFALANSINIAAVKLLAIVGVKNFLQKAYDMGIETLPPTDENLKRFGLSLTLGGGEVRLIDLTSAFSVFARGGIRKKPNALSEISDYKGKSIYIENEDAGKRILSPESSFMISHILSDDVARSQVFGLGSYLNIPGKTVAVKTGTTNDKRDNWTIGYTNGITVGVWVGNNDNSTMNEKIASGITGASPIWHRIMRELLNKYPDGIVSKPDNVDALIIDSYLGGLPKDNNSTRSEYFIKGTEPKDMSPFYKKLKISKSTGKLANEIEIKSGNYDEKDYILITENDPVSIDGKNLWQEGINQWLNDQKDEKYHAPKEISDASADDAIVSIKSPDDKALINSSDHKVQIKAKIASLLPIKKTEIYFNNVQMKNMDGDRKDIDETFDLADGVYELKITVFNEKDKRGESVIKFGVNKPWDFVSPTLTPTPTPE